MDLPAPREHTINRGIFQRQSWFGVEPDALMPVVLLAALPIVPILLSFAYHSYTNAVALLVGDAVFFAVSFLGLWIVHRIDPRAMSKIRRYFRLAVVHRARPSIIARMAMSRR